MAAFVTIVIVASGNSVSDNIVTRDSNNTVPAEMQSGSGQGCGGAGGPDILTTHKAWRCASHFVLLIHVSC